MEIFFQENKLLSVELIYEVDHDAIQKEQLQ